MHGHATDTLRMPKLERLRISSAQVGFKFVRICRNESNYN